MYLHGPCNQHGDILAAQYQVMCDDCKTSGPMTANPARALRGWELMTRVRMDAVAPYLGDFFSVEEAICGGTV